MFKLIGMVMGEPRSYINIYIHNYIPTVQIIVVLHRSVCVYNSHSNGYTSVYTYLCMYVYVCTIPT